MLAASSAQTIREARVRSSSNILNKGGMRFFEFSNPASRSITGIALQRKDHDRSLPTDMLVAQPTGRLREMLLDRTVLLIVRSPTGD
jgi:hypothetical protein